MSGGTISNNRATTEGGGVFVDSIYSTFHMTGGTITGNTAAYGGGVATSNKTCDFQKKPGTDGKSGIIFNNQASIGKQVSASNYNDPGRRNLDNTVDENHHLDNRTPGAPGGWVE
jgi:hypothetical protein